MMILANEATKAMDRLSRSQSVVRDQHPRVAECCP
jgi:hypothetical protein